MPPKAKKGVRGAGKKGKAPAPKKAHVPTPPPSPRGSDEDTSDASDPPPQKKAKNAKKTAARKLMGDAINAQKAEKTKKTKKTAEAAEIARRAAEHDDESEDLSEKDDDGTPIKMTPRKKRVKRDPLLMPQEVEEAVIIWLSEHKELWHKKVLQFHDRPMKDKLWQDKAKEISKTIGREVTADALRTWYKSMRTNYGKMSKQDEKSGAGSSERSERNQWVLEKFAFCKQDITRQVGRSVVHFGPPNVLPNLEYSDDDDSDAVADAVVDVQDEDGIPPPPPYPGITSASTSTSTSTSTAAGSSVTPRRLKQTHSRNPRNPRPPSPTQTREQVMADLGCSIDRGRELSARLEAALDRAQDKKVQWGLYLSTEQPTIDDRVWTKYRDDSYRLLQQAQADSDRLRQQDQQAHPPPLVQRQSSLPLPSPRPQPSPRPRLSPMGSPRRQYIPPGPETDSERQWRLQFGNQTYLEQQQQPAQGYFPNYDPTAYAQAAQNYPPGPSDPPGPPAPSATYGGFLPPPAPSPRYPPVSVLSNEQQQQNLLNLRIANQQRQNLQNLQNQQNPPPDLSTSAAASDTSMGTGSIISTALDMSGIARGLAAGSFTISPDVSGVSDRNASLNTPNPTIVGGATLPDEDSKSSDEEEKKAE